MFSSHSLKKFKPYTVASHKAWEVENVGNVLKLDWNESTISPSPLVKGACESFISKEMFNWYPDVNNSNLRSLIATYCGLNSNCIDYFGSSDSLHEYIIRAFCDLNSRILMLTPTYDNFRAVAESGGLSVFSHEVGINENDEELLKNIYKNLRLINPNIVYICNPNNPTGKLYSREFLLKLISNNSEVLFILDEAYYEFTGVTLSDVVEKHPNIIICRTFSKAFGLASFRIGYAIANQKNIEVLSKIKNHKNVNAFSQVAASAALIDLDYMRDYVSDVLLAKNDTFDYLSSKELFKPLASEGGNFICLEVDSKFKPILITELEKKLIFIRDLQHLNTKIPMIRITIGKREQMSRVHNAIDDILNRYLKGEI